MKTRNLAEILTLVADDLRSLEDVLQLEVAAADPLMQGLVHHVAQNRGKRLRAALVFLCGRAGGMLQAEHMRLACAAELLHNATLVHDDILDHAATRRGAPAVNAKWGSEIAVIFGDYLFSVAFSLIMEFPETRIGRQLAISTRAMVEGEMLQLQDRFQKAIPSTASYLRMIELKTASLMSSCTGLAGFLADRSADDEAWARFGHEFGMAFQIVDDCLDLMGHEGTMGKSLGTDLTTGKATLPFLKMLELSKPAERDDLLRRFWEPDDDPTRKRTRFVRLPVAQAAFEASWAQAASHIAAAKETLLRQRPSPFRDALEGLTDHLLIRQR